MTSLRRWTGRAILSCGVLTALAIGAGPQPLDAEEGTPDPRFGLIEPHDAPARADDLGAAWGRVRFHWALVQPNGPNEWVEAEITDEEIAQEIASGREILGLLIGIPEWARDDNGLPRGLYLSPSDPGNAWAGFVRAAVTRYQGGIDRWIVWNEPDVWDATHPGYTWPGDEVDYVQLLKVAYLVAGDENPSAAIHLAAMTHWWDALYGRELYFSRLMDALVADPEAAEHEYYHDAATLHVYFNPASVYEVIEQYRDIQAEHGLDKPIWLIETNAAPSSDPSWVVEEPTFHISLLEQAAYMPQALSLALAAGAERVGVYKLLDTPGDYAANPEPFGLVRADGSSRPAYRTAQVAFRLLAGAERLTWTDRHLVAQVIVERPGQVTRLLWSRVPDAYEARIPALSESATLVDMWGNESTISTEDGDYTITLVGGECQQTTGDYCMIGGPPIYVVEDVDTTLAPDLLGRLTLEAQPLQGILASDPSAVPRGWMVRWGAILAFVFGLALGVFAVRVRGTLVK